LRPSGRYGTSRNPYLTSLPLYQPELSDASSIANSLTPYSPVTTEKLTPADSYQILVAQRRNRPVSPHLSIYRPQITWYPSMFHRITGAMLSTGFYIFGAAYLVAPVLGWHLESASMAAAFATWPVALKIATEVRGRDAVYVP